VRAVGLQGGGSVKDDGVESSHCCCALMIGLEWISESRLGHSQFRVLCPSATSSSYSAARRGPTTMDRLAPPIKARGQTGMGIRSHSVGCPLGSIQQVGPIKINLTSIGWRVG
jgi:hypothetical protein